MRVRLTIAAILLSLLPAGCSGQMHPTNPTYTCPPAPWTGSGYSVLNPVGSTNPPVSGTTYTDANLNAGAWCYIAQSWDGIQNSMPSNIAGPFVVATSQSVDLTWTQPATNLTYILSRAAAQVISAPPPPVLGQGVIAMYPATSWQQLAMNPARGDQLFQLLGAIRR